MTARKFTNGRLEAALRKHDGILTFAAKELKVSRQAVHERVRSSPRIQEVLVEVKETTKDICEGTVLKAAKKGDVGRASWYLERQAPERGYANKNQVETKLSEGELEAIAAAFGGDLDKLRKLRAALDPPKTSEP